jgi:putative endonuclease
LQIIKIGLSLQPLFKALVHKSIGPVVQLVRIHACHAWGRGFESRPDRKGGHQKEAPFFIMAYFVYILYSNSSKTYYKGFTENPKQRLFQHNNDLSKFTKDKGPWEMVYLAEFPSKRKALIEEKRIKKLKERSIQKLINSQSNIVNENIL